MLDDTLSLPIDERYTLVALTAEDGPDVQSLLERSADYSELVMGLPPGPAEAQSLYIDLPKGKGYEVDRSPWLKPGDSWAEHREPDRLASAVTD